MFGKRSWRKTLTVGGLAWILASVALAEDWPQWRGPQRDGVWRETGIVSRFDRQRLQPVWKAEISSGYSGPTVANGRVYVTDRIASPQQLERIHCWDWKSGIPIWSYQYECPYKEVSYEAGPRAAVTIHDGRAYSLGTMGNLICLDAGTGTLLWKRDLYTEYDIRMPIWGIAAAPLIVDRMVIIQVGGNDGACVVAFDRKDGHELWRALNDRASYSSPILVEQGTSQVVVCWTGDSVAGMEAYSGEVLWRFPFPPRSVIIGISTPVVDRGQLFVTSFYDGSLMLRLARSHPGVEEAWSACGVDEKHTEALHSIISTPILRGDYLYGVDSYGELRCLDARTGKRIWEDRTATPRARWSNIHFVQHEEDVWMFNERGELIISQLSPAGFQEKSRSLLIDPTQEQLRQRNGVCWAHPAFANRHVFARNDKELICVSLEAGQ